MRRIGLAALVAVVVAAGCGSSGGGGGGGSGQVTIDAGGPSVTLTDARCFDTAEYGLTVLAGSQEHGEGKPDGISMTILHDPTLNATISGSLNGRPFALSALDAKGTISGKSGTFSGTDSLGSGLMFSGTFTCP
jgi:hypothetical protein